MRQHWRSPVLLALIVLLLAGCDVFDSINRPTEEIHMYGDAVNAFSFDKIPEAHITVQIDDHTQTFTGSYDVMVPVHQRLVISATAPGYQQYQAQTELNSQGEDELRSPLLLQPQGQ